MCNPEKVTQTLQTKIGNGKDIVLPSCAKQGCACAKAFAELTGKKQVVDSTVETVTAQNVPGIQPQG
jgi:hypothetical protein